MKGVGVILLLGVFSGWSSAVFLNHRPFPTYSLEEMPKTQFSCREKILGGYYADPEAQCQMFHICVKVAGVGIQDFRFLCPNGTAFDQDHQICADWEDVDCDATTLYYSSDNFDLYRVGSGFESKSFKYGEDEDVYALQRAETGDIRLNKEHQVQSVNQQKDPYQRPPKKINFNNNNNNRNNVNTNYNSNNNNYNNRNNNNKNDDEREIFQKSSSSNFFNNRNNGKENDEDYDDNVNVNQNEDFEQKRKVARKQQRRPIQQQQQNNFNRPQETTTTSTTVAPVQQTRRPHQRPTGFVNNFAGSSYVPTTKASTTSEQQPTTSNYNNNFRRAGNNVQRRPTTTNNNNVNYQQTNTQNNQNFNSPTPSYTISTPAPFSRQNTQAQNLNNKPTTFNTNQYTSNQFKNSDQFQSTTARLTENYPTQKPSTQSFNFNTNYDFPKQSKTENYPSNNPQYSKTTNENFNTPSYTPFDKKPTGLIYKPTTFSPKAKPFSVVNTQPQNTNVNDAFPTTFSPRTNQAFNQVAQQTQSFNAQGSNFNSQASFTTTTTQKPTAGLTHYTPTVPKISSTTPINKPVNRFDRNQYDDGSYDSRYDYTDNKDDEFLKTAHSQNIANSRNEYEKSLKQSTTQKYFEQTRGFTTSTENYPKNYPQATRNIQQRPVESAYKSTENNPKSTFQAQRNIHSTQQNTPAPQRNIQNGQKSQQNQNLPSIQNKKPVSPKKPKDYDYAYYDSAIPDTEDYQIDTDIKKERRN